MTGGASPAERLLAEGRSFDLEDQRAFADLSGDANPMHVDPVAARRLLFGGAVVHGVHSALWALDRWAATRDAPFRLTSLQASFPAPLPLHSPARVVELPSERGHGLRLEVRSAEGVAARVSGEWEPVADGDVAAAPAPVEWRRTPRDRTAEELAGTEGALALGVDVGAMDRLLPSLAARLDGRQAAVVLATTRLVGMEAPGLHSLYTRLSLTFEAPAADDLGYRVVTAHPRTGLVRLALESGGVQGEIQALVRPGPVDQLSAGDAADRVETDEFAGVEALVVGGSRGLGEVAAKLLAAGGAAVTCTYARGREDADRVAAEIRAAGGTARTERLDVLDPSASPPPAACVLYFASPRIQATDDPGFDREEFERYCDFYVAGFLRTLTGTGAVRAFYPSTVFIDRPPSGFESYAAAKLAGESLGRGLAPAVHVRAPRLPRFRTDQTSGVVRLSAEDPADRILAELRALFSDADSETGPPRHAGPHRRPQ